MSELQNILRQRAELYASIRSFFAERDILEVETPVFSKSGNTDPFIQSLIANFSSSSCSEEFYYAQTSPEFSMKRLLANGAGSIYQICKVFRVGEISARHNPEFTMLEWYRVGLDYHQLMDEMNGLLRVLDVFDESKKISYADLFLQYLNVNIKTAPVAQLKDCANDHGIRVVGLGDEIDDWLNLLLSHIIEPKLGFDSPTFIFDYPASQAALAEVREDAYPVAERFELYINGVEVANGYQELTRGDLYLQRFKLENERRMLAGKPEIIIHGNLIEDLNKGLPYCSGVAMGLDRLLMCLHNMDDIDKVLTYSADNA